MEVLGHVGSRVYGLGYPEGLGFKVLRLQGLEEGYRS